MDQLVKKVVGTIKEQFKRMTKLEEILNCFIECLSSSHANCLEKSMRLPFILICISMDMPPSSLKTLLISGSLRCQIRWFWLFYAHIAHCESHSFHLQEPASPVFQAGMNKLPQSKNLRTGKVYTGFVQPSSLTYRLLLA